MHNLLVPCRLNWKLHSPDYRQLPNEHPTWFYTFESKRGWKDFILSFHCNCNRKWLSAALESLRSHPLEFQMAIELLWHKFPLFSWRLKFSIIFPFIFYLHSDFLFLSSSQLETFADILSYFKTWPSLTLAHTFYFTLQLFIIYHCLGQYQHPLVSICLDFFSYWNDL